VRLRALVLLPALGSLAGCYVLEAARGQFDLNSRRVPIAQLLAAPGTAPELRAQLTLAERLRDFASRELSLPDNASYRSYADVGRRYVLWNVFATREFSVEPQTWCFPVAGCVAYRGYFAERRAREFALGLEARGFEVAVGGVAAYSTLGHFADPLTNTMLGWDETELAGLIFHELSHQLVYVKGDSAFNEAFATVVETEGVRRWLTAAGHAPSLAAFAARQARDREVAELVGASRGRLTRIYARAIPLAEKRALKSEEFARLRAAYQRRRAQWGGGYDWLFGPQLNNATLLTVATYRDCVPGLEVQLAAVERDLPRFYAEVRRLGNLPVATRRAALCRSPGGGEPPASR
jgi:predicted aminopeptidase